MEVLVVVGILSIAASMFLAGCGAKPIPKVTGVRLITTNAAKPSYASSVNFPPGVTGLNVNNLGPYNPINSSSIQYVLWVAFEGTNLDRVKIERFCYSTLSSNKKVIQPLDHPAYKGPGFKIPSDLTRESTAFDGPYQPQESQVVSNGSALITEDAPGVTGLISYTQYPIEDHKNFLVQAKYGKKVLAEIWFDTDIFASSSAPNGVETNKVTLTDWKVY